MSTAWNDGRLKALAAEISERMDRLRAEGVTVSTEGLDRRDYLAVRLNARLEHLRAQRSGNVIDAAHRFRSR